MITPYVRELDGYAETVAHLIRIGYLIDAETMRPGTVMRLDPHTVYLEEGERHHRLDLDLTASNRASIQAWKDLRKALMRGCRNMERNADG